MINKDNAEHYMWGASCDGWHFVKSDELSVIYERMPPNTSESMHLHQHSKQFFFILKGSADFEIDGDTISLQQQNGLEVAPRIPHRIINNSGKDVEFLVISAPKSRGDRIEII